MVHTAGDVDAVQLYTGSQMEQLVLYSAAVLSTFRRMSKQQIGFSSFAETHLGLAVEDHTTDLYLQARNPQGLHTHTCICKSCTSDVKPSGPYG